MVVAKRQGREKPKKIEQKEVQTQVEQTTLLYRLIYIVQVQGEEKKHVKRGAKGLGVSLSHMHALSLSPSHPPPLSLSLSL